MTRRRLLLLLVVLAGVAGGACLWHSWPERLPPLPSPDVEGIDPAVAAAVANARDEVRDKPRSAEAWGRLGMVLGVHGFQEEGLGCLETAARLDRQEPCWPYLAGVLLATSQPEEAIARVREALRRAKDSAEPGRLRLAGLLLASGEIAEAEEIYTRMARSPVTGAWARLELGRIALTKGEVKRSLTDLEPARARPGTAKASRLLLVEAYRRLGDAAAAERLAAEAANLPDDPDPPDPWEDRLERAQVGEQASLRRADALLGHGNVEPALAILTKAARDYPGSAAVWQMLGRAMLGARRLRLAEEAFRRAHEIDPKRAEVVFYLGVVAYEQGDRSRAAAEFARTTSVRPDHAMAWYNLGQCRSESGDKEGAIAAFRQSVLYKPHHAGGHLALARLLLEAKRPDEARYHLDLAARLTPEAAEVGQLRRALPAGK